MMADLLVGAVAVVSLLGGTSSAPETAAAQPCAMNTTYNGYAWHVKCSVWSGEYRAEAKCADGRYAYGIWKTAAQSQYIGSVADCGRAKVVVVGSGLGSR